MNLWSFFTSSCYSGFGGEDGAFYKVYAEVFASVVEDELRFGVSEGRCVTTTCNPL